MAPKDMCVCLCVQRNEMSKCQSDLGKNYTVPSELFLNLELPG